VGLLNLKGKNVTIIGLARSGIGAANLLVDLGARVTVTDTKTEDELQDFIRRLKPSVKIALGSHPEDIFINTDMLVISPGVPLDIPPLLLAKSKVKQIIGELELAYQVVRSQESGVRRNSIIKLLRTF
jgi:UDP-N-acetylmuramoylalanine--D-glutamate ligase